MNDDAPNRHRPTEGSATARKFGLRRPLVAVRRRIGLCVGMMAAVVGVAMLLTALQQPVFEATAEVVLDAGDRPALSPGSGTGRSMAERADDAVRVIRSRAMARRVMRALPPGLDRASTRPTGFVVGAVRRLGWTGAERDPRGAPIRAEETADRSVARLLGGLSVSRPDDTLSLMIGYTATDGATAARIANEYARQYTEVSHAAPRGAAASARIISEAEPPLSPISPRPLRNLLLAALAGLGCGVVGALVAERLFGGITSGDEIEDRLDLRHLGSVPLLATVLPEARSAPEAILQAPLSGFAETFRSLLQAIDHAGGRRARVVGITSALAGEGKTTVAICLARTIALRRERVVLVDCDARGGGLSAMFGGAGRPGLTEVLRGHATLDEALVEDEASGAYILPMAAPPVGSSAVPDSSALAALIEQLRRRFDHVVLDAPAVLPVAEARAIAATAELLIVLVRWRSTADRSVKAALRLLRDENARIGGVVLSRVDLRKRAGHAQGDPAFYYKQSSKYYS